MQPVLRSQDFYNAATACERLANVEPEVANKWLELAARLRQQDIYETYKNKKGL